MAAGSPPRSTVSRLLLPLGLRTAIHFSHTGATHDIAFNRDMRSRSHSLLVRLEATPVDGSHVQIHHFL